MKWKDDLCRNGDDTTLVGCQDRRKGDGVGAAALVEPQGLQPKAVRNDGPHPRRRQRWPKRACTKRRLGTRTLVAPPNSNRQMVSAEAMLGKMEDTSVPQVMMRDRLLRRLPPRRRLRGRRKTGSETSLPPLRLVPLVSRRERPSLRGRLTRKSGRRCTADKVRPPGGLQLGRRAIARRRHGRRSPSAHCGPLLQQGPRHAVDGVRLPGGPRRLGGGAKRWAPKRVHHRRGSAGQTTRLPHGTCARCMSLSTAARAPNGAPGGDTAGARRGSICSVRSANHELIQSAMVNRSSAALPLYRQL